MRVLLSYFLGINNKEMVYINNPLHHLIKLILECPEVLIFMKNMQEKRK